MCVYLKNCLSHSCFIYFLHFWLLVSDKQPTTGSVKELPRFVGIDKELEYCKTDSEFSSSLIFHLHVCIALESIPSVPCCCFLLLLPIQTSVSTNDLKKGIFNVQAVNVPPSPKSPTRVTGTKWWPRTELCLCVCLAELRDWPAGWRAV